MLKGFDPYAKDNFQHGSFSLLTSRHEGQGLVLLESMAVGCIPIAYDIKYGPASIITHGVDGFLVTAGDVEELAQTVEYLINMPEDQRARMRQAAIRRADDYTPERITRRWGEVLRRAQEKKVPVREVPGAAKLAHVEVDGAGFGIVVDVMGLEGSVPEWVTLTWAGRGSTVFGRVRAEVVSHSDGVRVSGWLPIRRLMVGGSGIVDIFVDVRMAGNPRRMRVQTDRRGMSGGQAKAELYATEYGNVSIRLRSDLTCTREGSVIGASTGQRGVWGRFTALVGSRRWWRTSGK